MQSQQGAGETEAQPTKGQQGLGVDYRRACLHPSAPSASPALLIHPPGVLAPPLSIPNHITTYPLHFCTSSDQLNVFFQLCRICHKRQNFTI